MAKPRSLHFFATGRDLEALLASVESQRPLKYVQAGMFNTPETVVLTSGLQIPNLGLAPSGDNNLEPFWLITDPRSRTEIETVPQRRGGTRYCIDPGLNPESVVFWPGGVFQKSCVIAGQIGTGMNNPSSSELLNLFAREMRRQFERIKSFFVGMEAERLLNSGYRLTTNVYSPKDYDLSRD